MKKIAPSILSADFTRLGADIESVSIADYIHFDVMDGVFVPNISVGLPVLKCVRKSFKDAELDVHLMITQPVRYVEQFCKCGADIVTVHLEADTEDNIIKAMELIRANDKRAGVSVKPGTPRISWCRSCSTPI
jgi:ribulose-phosphate 3-epimerase